MFTTQISSIETQIQELTAKLDQYRALDSEMIAAVEAIAKIQEVAQSLNVQDEVMEKLAAAVGVTPMPPDPSPNKPDTEMKQKTEQVTPNEVEVKTFEILECSKIQSALASSDQSEVDGCLLAIANHLENCPQDEAADKAWFFVQNVGVEFDKCILEFLSENIRTEWGKARTLFEKAVKASLFAPRTDSEIRDKPENETISDGQLNIFNAIEEVRRYETAAEIAEALADEDEVDTHLMAIASILDSCPAIEIPGRVWFFVQNIPTEFDDRILGYLPKSIRPEWDKQRTLLEEEARGAQEPTAEPEISPGDLVQIHSGEICEVLQAKDIGGRMYVEVMESGNRKTAYRDTDLKLVDIEEARASILPPTQPHYFDVNDLAETPTGKIGHITDIHFDNQLGRVANVVCPNGIFPHPVSELKYIGKYQAPADPQPGVAPIKTTTKKSKKVPKATSADILKCKNWAEIRAIANNNPQLIKQAATAAHTKAEKELIENLPELIKNYMYESRDFSDLDWLPNYIKQRVRCLLSEPGAAA